MPPSDEELVKKSLKDTNCFANLIERYEDKLKAYIRRISNFSEAEAEEILQEVFLKAWKNLRDFDQSLKFSTWIYRITHNQTISSYRKHHSRGYDQQISLEDTLFELKSPELNLPEKIDRKNLSALVKKILSALPEKYREVLVLKYFEDKSYEEIADILKKPMGTVATLLNRAKKVFKQESKNFNF